MIDESRDSVVAIIPAGPSPLALGYNGVDSRVYAASHDSARVTVIDGVSDSVVAVVPVGRLPGGCVTTRFGT